MTMFTTDNVYCVDSYKAIKDIPDKSIDMIYTDIPYFYVKGGNGGNSRISECARNKNISIKEITDGIDYAIYDEFVRVMKKINCFIWCSKMQMLETMKFFVEKHGCYFDLLTWNKTSCCPQTKLTWLPNIEYCFHFREKGVLLNDGYDLKSKWYVSPTNKRDKDKFEHPTIKPLPFVEQHIRHAMQTQQDVVLDPFCGSGTTLVAAKNIGLHYIGFEIEEKYAEIARNRLNNTGAGGQMSLITF